MADQRTYLTGGEFLLRETAPADGDLYGEVPPPLEVREISLPVIGIPIDSVEPGL